MSTDRTQTQEIFFWRNDNKITPESSVIVHLVLQSETTRLLKDPNLYWNCTGKTVDGAVMFPPFVSPVSTGDRYPYTESHRTSSSALRSTDSNVFLLGSYSGR